MIRINLLPPEKRKKLKKARPAKKKQEARPGKKLNLRVSPAAALAATVAIVSLLGMAVAHVWLNRLENSLDNRRASAREELIRLNQVVLRIDELRAKNQEIARKMNIIAEVDRDRYLWPRLLDEISNALPQYTWLETVSEISPLPELRLRIEGLTMSNQILSRLMENLERSPLLEKIELVSSVERSEGSFSSMYFILECSCELKRSTVGAGAVTAAR